MENSELQADKKTNFTDWHFYINISLIDNRIGIYFYF